MYKNSKIDQLALLLNHLQKIIMQYHVAYKYYLIVQSKCSSDFVCSFISKQHICIVGESNTYVLFKTSVCYYNTYKCATTAHIYVLLVKFILLIELYHVLLLC